MFKFIIAIAVVGTIYAKSDSVMDGLSSTGVEMANGVIAAAKTQLPVLIDEVKKAKNGQ